MAVTLVEGFDPYTGVAVNTGLQAKWTLSAVTNVAMVTGRFGGQGVQCTIGASSGHLNRLFTASASVVVGCAARFTTLTGAAPTAAVCPFLILRSAATYMIGLKVTSTGALEVFRMSATYAGTSLGTSAAAVITLSSWHYIEMAVDISDTVGTITVKVDGTAVITLTAQDTRNGTPTTVDTVQFGDVYGLSFTGAWVGQFDDVYVTDSSTLIGERRVETLYPTSDVAQGFARSAGAVNYSLVDEATVNGDTDYVQGTTVGDVDTYGLGDLSSTPVTIDAVLVSAFAMKTDAAARSIALQVKSGATTQDGANFALAASYSKHERMLLTDPNTSAAWTTAAVNALQAGPKVTV